jgi:hypothetical protein
LLLGISLVGLVEATQKIGEATRNGFFQEIAVIAAKGLANACPNGVTDVFLSVGTISMSGVPRDTAPPCR